MAFRTMLLMALIPAFSVPALLAFSPTTTILRRSPKWQSSIPLASSIDENVASGDWELTNDFSQFLTVCSVQSFLFVLSSLRDLHTIRWVDNFTQPVIDSSRSKVDTRLTGTTEATTAITSDLNIANPNGRTYSKLLTYHGLAAMNTTRFPTWDSYFATLLEKPVEVFVVQSSGIQVKEYDLDINPASLCSRIISVREQIAHELVHDLGVVATMGQHTMDSYRAYMGNLQTRDDEDEEIRKTSKYGGGGGGDDDVHNVAAANRNRDKATMSSGADGSPRILPPHNLVFLDYNLDSMNGISPSPIRKSNFDLAVLLATQESVHRILNQHFDDPKFGIFQHYLFDFYTQRITSHFSGIQRYGRADDFLEELLFSSPRASTSGGLSILVDPVQVAEMILEERAKVAVDWQNLSRSVPNDHISIKRLQLDRLMQSYNS